VGRWGWRWGQVSEQKVAALHNPKIKRIEKKVRVRKSIRVVEKQTDKAEIPQTLSDRQTGRQRNRRYKISRSSSSIFYENLKYKYFCNNNRQHKCG
jgi:hypothetical protein